jgi:cell fate (sporulation/competence/biofilm development) regulator YmcA (YheA/YmcA/DUF963 family)
MGGVGKQSGNCRRLSEGSGRSVTAVSDHHHGDHDCPRSTIPSFKVEEVLLKEDVLAKARELAGLIAASEEVRIFREAERKVQNHTEVQDLIRQIKKKQKEIVGFEYFKNDQMVRKIEGEIAELEQKLNRYPVVQEFKQTQDDINQLLQLVVGVIRDTVSEQIAVDGGTPPAPATCSD